MTKRTKIAAVQDQERAIFKLFSLGISTNRDEWLYDQDRNTLEKKAKFLIRTYDAVEPKTELFPNTIKWSETLKRRKKADSKESFMLSKVRKAAYRPFSQQFIYQSALYVDRPGLMAAFFPLGETNRAIKNSEKNLVILISVGNRAGFDSSACNQNVSLDYFVPNAASMMARYHFIDSVPLDNITDWALDQFQTHYGAKFSITKDDIFKYVYAVLYDPIYRDTYALNLKREFPRIPFYPDFFVWRDWGNTLLDIHINYETAQPFPLKRTDAPDKKSSATPRTILRADRDAGIIVLDSETQLSGVPVAAWDYRLANRSAIDWVLDQHKEKKPKDPTIREKFNTYRFADYKDSAIDLLKRVTTVSIETVKITEAMRKLPRG